MRGEMCVLRCHFRRDHLKINNTTGESRQEACCSNSHVPLIAAAMWCGRRGLHTMTVSSPRREERKIDKVGPSVKSLHRQFGTAQSVFLETS